MLGWAISRFGVAARASRVVGKAMSGQGALDG